MSLGVRARPLRAQPDERLVELARDGQERAFEMLVRRHEASLLRYCRRFAPSPERAEEVLQQSLLSAWLAIRSGAEVREPRPWLFRIAHNTALNAIRAAPPQVSLDVWGADALPRGAPATGANQSAAAAFEETARARDVLAGMASLPAAQREALLRATLGGESYGQVAAALGVSNGAVRGLLHRARATLRERAAAALVPGSLLARGLGLVRLGGAPSGAATCGAGARSVLAALAAGAVIAGGFAVPGANPLAAKGPAPQEQRGAPLATVHRPAAPAARAVPAVAARRQGRPAGRQAPARTAAGEPGGLGRSRPAAEVSPTPPRGEHTAATEDRSQSDGGAAPTASSPSRAIAVVARTARPAATAVATVQTGTAVPLPTGPAGLAGAAQSTVSQIAAAIPPPPPPIPAAAATGTAPTDVTVPLAAAVASGPAPALVSP